MTTELIVNLSVDEVSKILHEIRTFSCTAGKAWYEFGKRWLYLHDNKSHKVMQFQTFDEFIRSYTHYSRSWVYFTMAVARVFGRVIETSTQVDIEFSRLRDALPLIETDTDAEVWFNRAKSLPLEGWRDELREAQGKLPTDE